MKSSRPRRPKEPELSADRLREIGIFGALSDTTLERLTQDLAQLRFAPGEVVFKEGDPAREMFVVLDGELEVLKRSRKGRDARVAILGPNDAFGEMSIIDVMPRSATIRALAPTRLLRLRTEDLDALYRYDLKSYAIITLNVARDLSRRLRVTDGMLADFTSMVEHYGPGSYRK